ncbi:arrestin domain-containing protein 3-like [Rhincodon typus]|uniref:arrestin domain-containing protein 3-like n=1 Tax=Rhincodon typus TaxID=259920 RepID=UPI00202F0F1A|nr:arrestin domain-containing protein 3-like [Rhincodon typus]
MGKVTNFTILYDRAVDNNVPTYSCGEWVSGRIIVEVNAQIEVKALKIHAKGRPLERNGLGLSVLHSENQILQTQVPADRIWKTSDSGLSPLHLGGSCPEF